jgi:hypothetical protein
VRQGVGVFSVGTGEGLGKGGGGVGYYFNVLFITCAYIIHNTL